MSTAITPNHISIELSPEHTILIDAVDADLAEFAWHLRAGGRTFYAVRNESRSKGETRTKLTLHRVVLSRMLNRELSSDEIVDHINGNGLDNRRENLRLATHSQNLRNSRVSVSSTSGYKGVHWIKRAQKWQAMITANGKRKYLGSFDTAEEAHAAYCAAANFYYGDFANSGEGSIADYIKSISGGVES